MYDKHADAKAYLANIDRDIDQKNGDAEQLRRQISRLRFFKNPVWLTLICAGEVACLLLLSLLCLGHLPIAVWLILFFLARREPRV